MGSRKDTKTAATGSAAKTTSSFARGAHKAVNGDGFIPANASGSQRICGPGMADRVVSSAEMLWLLEISLPVPPQCSIPNQDKQGDATSHGE